MRADLQTMEQIDLYLQGKMSATESTLFESKMASDPELGALVDDQQLLAQSVNRKALLAEIHLVAGSGGGAWYSNPYVGFAGATIVVGIIAAAVYYGVAGDDTETISQNEFVIPTTEINSGNLNGESTLQTSNDSVQYTYGNRLHTASGVPTGQDQYPDGEKESYEILSSENDGALVADGKTDGNNLENKIVNTGSELKVTNKLACFPNGYQAMRAFVSEKIIYPGTAKKEKMQANVRVQFVVGKEGQISNIESNCFKLRDENDKPLNATQMVLNQKIVKLFEDKSTAAIRTMPGWEPATDSQGNNVVSVVTVYFNFSLKEGISIYQLQE